MDSLRAVRIFFANRTTDGPQRLGSNCSDDKMKGNYPSNTSETSEDSLEAGSVNFGKLKKPGFGRRVSQYARGRKTSFAVWSSAQPGSVWATIILAFLGIVVILYVYPPVHMSLATCKEDMADTQQCSICSVDIL